MEQFEIIDIRPEEEVKKTWKKFIHTHHYNYGNNYFESVLSRFPRRTSESYFHAYMPNTIKQMFQESNPIPENFNTFEELWDWFKPLIEAENKWKLQRRASDQD